MSLSSTLESCLFLTILSFSAAGSGYLAFDIVLLFDLGREILVQEWSRVSIGAAWHSVLSSEWPFQRRLKLLDAHSRLTSLTALPCEEPWSWQLSSVLLASYRHSALLPGFLLDVSRGVKGVFQVLVWRTFSRH